MHRFIPTLGLLASTLTIAASALATPVTVSSPVRVLADFADVAPRGTMGTVTYEFDPMLPGTLDPDTGTTTVEDAVLSLTIVLGSLTLETSGIGHLYWRDETDPGSDCDPLFTQACRDIVLNGDFMTLGALSLTEPLPVVPRVPPRPGFPPPGGYVATGVRLFFSDPNDDPLAPPDMITDGVVPADESPFDYQIQIGFLDADGFPLGGLALVAEPATSVVLGSVAALVAAGARRGRRRQPGSRGR